MALKVLMLRKQQADKRKELEALRAAATAYQTREAELEKAIAEATTEEEKETVTAAVEEFETEKSTNATAQSKLDEEINDIERQIKEIEDKGPPAHDIESKKEEREAKKKMETRTKFYGMSMEQRDAFFAREEVHSFLERTRELGMQRRAVSGGELLIPEVVLELVKERVTENSKLYARVSVRQVPGHARQTVMGAIPEGVWTEMCAKLNELKLDFSGVEVDGYKVGGYIPVCNALLQDSDVALASEIIEAMGRAIGIALDKAILYGTGTKMPLGVLTRLAQTAEPSDYPATAREWEDLHTTNVIAITGKTGLDLYKEIIKASGAAKGKYSNGGRFWAMNEKTHNTLTAEALSINAAGAIVSGTSGTMPVIGGDIVELEFIPDNVIIGGFGDLYLLVERQGTTIAQSEHVRFVEDQTVFKGTARYDGMPVIAEGFVALGIAGNTPSASGVTFAGDTANP